MFRLIKRLPWITAGAATVWFFDPERGRERRIIAKHRIAELTGSAELDPRLHDSVPEGASIGSTNSIHDG